MHKKLATLALIATSAAILGGCTNKEAVKDQSAKEVVSEAKQLADAIKSGRPTHCVMTKDEDKMEYWIKGKMFKMNVLTTTKDEETNKTTTTKGYMISDNTYMYSWNDQSKQGSKFKIPTEQEVKEMTEEAKKYEDLSPKFDDEAGYESLKNEGYTIDCKGTDIKDADFIPPSDITFVDPTEMFKNIQGEGGEIDLQKLQEMAKQYEGMGDN